MDLYRAQMHLSMTALTPHVQYHGLVQDSDAPIHDSTHSACTLDLYRTQMHLSMTALTVHIPWTCTGLRCTYPWQHLQCMYHGLVQDTNTPINDSTYSAYTLDLYRAQMHLSMTALTVHVPLTCTGLRCTYPWQHLQCMYHGLVPGTDAPIHDSTYSAYTLDLYRTQMHLSVTALTVHVPWTCTGLRCTYPWQELQCIYLELKQDSDAPIHDSTYSECTMDLYRTQMHLSMTAVTVHIPWTCTGLRCIYPWQHLQCIYLDWWGFDIFPCPMDDWRSWHV